jgi:hypothetical protein
MNGDELRLSGFILASRSVANRQQDIAATPTDIECATVLFFGEVLTGRLEVGPRRLVLELELGATGVASQLLEEDAVFVENPCRLVAQALSLQVLHAEIARAG